MNVLNLNKLLAGVHAVFPKARVSLMLDEQFNHYNCLRPYTYSVRVHTEAHGIQIEVYPGEDEHRLALRLVRTLTERMVSDAVRNA